MCDTLPKNPMLCLSVVNTKLRDYYRDIDTLCRELEIEKEALIAKLREIDYEYDASCNQFV